MYNYVNFSDLQGHVITKIEGVSYDSEEIVIYTETNIFKMFHNQHCCENVSVEDFVYSGSENLEGATILEAEESTSDCDTCSVSGTWTFYKLKTDKGELFIRWLGTSNGYYSERVSVCRYELEN